MVLEKCSDLKLILLTIFVISLIVLMEQIAEYIHFKKDSNMKIKIVSLYFPSFFNGDRLSAFADKIKFFIMYKKHWWQRYRYMKDLFGHPMKFDSQEEAEEYLEREGIDYQGKA
nr:MAG TPA: Putative oxidoreductase [Caudoviricetes sp.]